MKVQKIDIKDLLPLVRRPSRYMGGEVNSIKKDHAKVKCVFGLAFPDAYEIGMSHLGIQILYQALNSVDHIACERVFAPWIDMEALLRSRGLKLTTLESGVELDKLDILGFSLQYELSYTNIVNMLDLGGIPKFSADRNESDPFVIGGGPNAFNPEPIADFFDAILLGDGEVAAIAMAEAVIAGRAANEGRRAILERMSRIQGVYVPSFFEVSYNDDATVKEIKPLYKDYKIISKSVVADINASPLPVRPIVPYLETIHDRISVEISRGCTRGCRFCQAGNIYRPIRERTPENIFAIVEQSLKNTGHDEVSLLSLSAGDYTQIAQILPQLMERYCDSHVAMSLPSLRVGTLGTKLATQIRRVRKTGFTLAPEAGSERLRQLINKGIKEDDLKTASSEIFTLGWKALKLYFMIGLPTETDEDILEITRLTHCVREIGKRASGRNPEINASAAVFIPKPHTPFQWEPQLGIDEGRRRLELLRRSLSDKRLGFKWQAPEMSFLEGVFSRGDRRLSAAIVEAHKSGCRFDGWSEQFRFNDWMDAFSRCKISPDFYVTRRRDHGEVFPWDHLSSGVTKKFLIKEMENALALSYTEDCKLGRCTNCGACDHKNIKNRAATVPFINDPVKSGQSAPRAPVKFALRFTKTDNARFLSHLELMLAITRLIRRAGLALNYSAGFHPMPRLSFESSLPVGMSSIDERMEIELMSPGIEADEIKKRLNLNAPAGIEFIDVSPITLKSAKPSVTMIEYHAIIKESLVGPGGLNIDFGLIDGILRDFKEMESLIFRIEKENKAIEADIKAHVADISVFDRETGCVTVRIVMKNGQPSLRPHDALAGIFKLARPDASLIPVIKVRAVN